ncbi:MAG: MoxR family ATPase [Acidimicrobiales bacterium]|jgi:MoxR-like ATPase
MDLGTRTGLEPQQVELIGDHPVLADAAQAATVLEAIVANVGRVLQGNDEAIKLSVVCLIAGGHLLVEDVPGVGKTSLGKALSASVSCRHRRIQFTSDLLPSDVTGVNVFDVNKSSFEFRPGPIFANILLGDEINRTPPKTQSALLEAMEERQVTVDGVTYHLPDPFMVIATQNPLEHEGTFPLPVSQLDRFLLRIRIGYPAAEAEVSLLETHGVSEPLEVLQPVATPEDVVALAVRVRGVHTSTSIQHYIVQIANATRTHPAVMLGMSPRAALALQRAARARAVLEGREFVSPDDVKAMAEPVIGHRLELRMPVGRGRDHVGEVLEEILRQVPVPDVPLQRR